VHVLRQEEVPHPRTVSLEEAIEEFRGEGIEYAGGGKAASAQ